MIFVIERTEFGSSGLCLGDENFNFGIIVGHLQTMQIFFFIFFKTQMTKENPVLAD